ncbi:hypothetical protein [Plantactinospora sonchi]|uniref:Uncharacterized protein n=1 Tax=Plantactinospora sonchi TaxID=1544735 RepID=A0ABU7S550_9ACTN
MGFDLDCYFAVDDEVLPLYERLVPGGSRWVVPVSGHGLPAGWILPDPWYLHDVVGGKHALAEGWTRDDGLPGWRAAAGVPAQPDPLDLLDDGSLQVASLLSLAAPAGVLVLGDHTFGGTLIDEYAAALVRGRLRAAAGIDHRVRGGEPGGFVLRDGRYQQTDPATLSPVADCAAVLDRRFAGASLFDGYLPRDALSQLYAEPRPTVSAIPGLDPATVSDWIPHFPILAADQ